MNKPKRIFVLAGEQSGDLLGGKLLEAIRAQSTEPVEFVGVGGQTMTAAGLNSLFPMEDLSIMGFVEVIQNLFQILRRLKEVTNYIKDTKPDVVVTIDLPDFSFRLAKKLRHLGIPHIHYTAPTVWAWRPGRAKKIAKIIDHLLCILPFEPPYFTKHHLPATFIGHMVTELGIEQIPREKFRTEHNLSAKDTLLCLLPGSRKGEVERLLPIFKDTIRKLKIHHPDMKLVVPVVANVEEMVRQGLADVKIPMIFVTTQQERYEAMRACNVALAASGTVNLELAMAQVPFVIGYKMHPFTAIVARPLITIKYITMVNILLDRPAIPEFVQNDCAADNLFKATHKFLSDQIAAETVVKSQLEATNLLRPSQGTPSDMAAKVILDLCNTELQLSENNKLKNAS